MLLSVGMIVKNEEKYLGRCLEAVSAVLREVSGELIIADTGSTDQTVEIARQFTENVFHFDWCDDFSAARNSTLKKARGKWFMYLDADEIIEDGAGLIRFFNSGEYRNYNSATLAITSFNDESRKATATMLIARLVKMSKGLAFINAIHERLDPIMGPCKNLDVTVSHYGYVTMDNEERIRQKTENNLRIMFAEENKRPDDCENLFNICQTLLIKNDKPAALAYCGKGLLCARKQKHFYEVLFYARKAQILDAMGDMSNLLATADEYFRSKDTVLATDIEMYVYKATSCAHFHAYREAAEALKAYVKTLRDYKNGLLETPDMYCHSINYTDAGCYAACVVHLMELLIRLGEFEEAGAASHSLEVESYQDNDGALAKKLGLDMEIMRATGDFSFLPVLYGRLKEERRPTLQTLAEDVFENEDFSRSAARAFCDAGAGETPYARLMRLRYLYFAGRLTARDVEALLDDIEEGDLTYADLVYFAFYSGASPELLGRKFDPFEFAAAPRHIGPCGRSWPAFSKTIALDENDPGQAARHLWTAALHERVLVSDGAGDGEKADIFDDYALHFGAYLRGVLNMEAVTEKTVSLLPRPLRLGLLCCLAAGFRESGKSVDYIRCLRSILKTEPRLRGLIQALIGKHSDSAKPAQPDFAEYARMIKNNIAALCAQNETEKALAIIAQYEQLCPDDEEIRSLKKRLTEK